MNNLHRFIVALALFLPIAESSERGSVYAQPGAPSALELGAFGADIGTISAIFIGWNDPPPCIEGKTTFIWWESHGVSLDSIIAGGQDDVIKSFASQLCPGTIIAPFHEMELVDSPWSGAAPGNSAAKVVKAWKHIHDIIGLKAKYAWVVNNGSIPRIAGNRPADYWPGADYVDIVGIDGFDWGGLSFYQAISPNISELKTYGKPVWVTSFGTAKSPTQAAWVANAIQTAKAIGIKALIYFSHKDRIDFTLTPEARAEFR